MVTWRSSSAQGSFRDFIGVEGAILASGNLTDHNYKWYDDAYSGSNYGNLSVAAIANAATHKARAEITLNDSVGKN